MSELIIPRRFCGPPDSGNGGWTAGALSTRLPPAEGAAEGFAVEVTLRQPPPLDTAVSLTHQDGTMIARLDDDVVASARRVRSTLTAVESIGADEARAAEAAYAGHLFHPFPTCFACGTGRDVGDGLRIFPGVVRGERVAATWLPEPSQGEGDRASVPVTWAALDCVGGWAGDLTERLMVLGRMTAQIDALPLLGEDHVVVGERRGSDGRKTFTAATLYDSSGAAVARAEHVWIAVDPAAFGGVQPG